MVIMEFYFAQIISCLKTVKIIKKKVVKYERIKDVKAYLAIIWVAFCRNFY